MVHPHREQKLDVNERNASKQNDSWLTGALLPQSAGLRCLKPTLGLAESMTVSDPAPR